MENPQTSNYDKSFAKGKVLFRENEKSSDMYIIKSGKIEIFLERMGEEVLLETLGKGDVLGEMSLFDNHPRSASARIIEEAELTVINRDVFNKRLETIPKWLVSIISILIHRLRGADKNLGDSVLKDELYNTTTILTYVMGKIQKSQTNLKLSVLRTESKEKLAIDEVVFNEIIDKISQEGIIEENNGTITQLDEKLCKKYISSFRSILSTGSQLHVDISDPAFECLTILLVISGKKGVKSHRGVRVEVNADESEIEKKIIMLLDKNVQNELTTSGLLDFETEITLDSKKIDLVFDQTKIEKFVEFHKIVRLFN